MSRALPLMGQSRLFYLDALRAFCMLYGVLLHGTAISYAGEPLFGVIVTTSAFFRMATFFVITGFFTAMAYSRRSLQRYVKSRGQVLFLPLVSTMILLIPITNYLIHTWHNGPMSLQDYFWRGGWARPSQGNDVWHLHLWFLMSLTAYAALAPVLDRLVCSHAFARLVGWFVRRPPVLGLVLLAIGFAFVAMAMRGFYDQFIESLVMGTRSDWVVLITLYYLPFFALGFAMYRQPGLFRLMHQINLLGLLLFAGLLLAAETFRDQIARDLFKVMYWTGRAGLILMIVAAMIRVFELYFNQSGRVLSFLVESAFTFYLFHLTVIFLVAWAMRPLSENIYAIFAVILLVVPPIVFALHAHVIAPNATLSLMFNGRVRRKPMLVA